MNNYSMAELLLCISDKQWTGPNGDNVHFVDGEWMPQLLEFGEENPLGAALVSHTRIAQVSQREVTEPEIPQ